MTSWTHLTLPFSVILLAACTPTPDEVAATSDMGSSSTTSAGPGPSTTPGTTMPGEDTVGTMGATGMETTMGAVDTTAGTSSSTDETTMGVGPTTSGSSSSGGESSSSSSSSSGPPPPECMNDDECENNQVCDLGMCVEACGGTWGAGTYGGCLDDLGGLDTPNVCGANHLCIADDHPYAVTVCSAQTCATNCDCPEPPATGNAIVTCASITFGDMVNDCYLSCQNGETCPDGMECLNGLLCAVTVPDTVPMYGNCDDLEGVTCDGGTCGISGSNSVCSEGGCANAGACDPAPPGAMAPQCADVFNPPGGNDCFLPCNAIGDCPPGAQCIDVPGPTNACMF